MFCLVDASNGEHEACADILTGAIQMFAKEMLGKFFSSRAI
jgi:hypothetical protein